MSPRSSPPLGPPVALDRVPRLVDVLDESDEVLTQVTQTTDTTDPDLGLGGEPVSSGESSPSSDGSSGLVSGSSPSDTGVDTVLDDCLDACRGFLKAEIERRVRLQVDQHAQARFEAWLSHARLLWESGNARSMAPTSTEPHASEAGDEKLGKPLPPGTDSVPDDRHLDWDDLRDRLAVCLDRRWPR
jgi:hypothetical protein